MSRDLELLKKYANYNESANIVDLLRRMTDQAGTHISEFKIIDVLDLNMFKEQVNELMDFLFVAKRFRHFEKLFNGSLILDSGHQYFEVDGHQFKTLDEVEKTWNNKAFL